MNRKRKFKFRLYVAGDAQNSAQAIANLNEICRAYLPGRHEVEIVDVLLQPHRAMAEGIFMTPTLVKFAPGPSRRIVGTLSQPEVVIQALGLKQVAA